ncbi:MAG: hypothetical protein U9P90_01365 [Patescibacteria group bacterium]|nr:hypothetical protein [Patescibacteria group bacterium]
MLPWIACGFVFSMVFVYWFIFRKNPRAKWTLGEVVLFILFVVAQVIDVAQTHFLVNVLTCAREANPIYVDGFDVLPASLSKIGFILLVFVLLWRSFSIFGRYLILVVVNLIFWAVDIYGGMFLYSAICDLM